MLFVDVIQKPTNTSHLHHPYAPVGYTTYGHIDPAKAALRAGSYQWEWEIQVLELDARAA